MARGVAGEFALEREASEGEEYVSINVRVESFLDFEARSRQVRFTRANRHVHRSRLLPKR